jgi:hypothetical protein
LLFHELLAAPLGHARVYLLVKREGGGVLFVRISEDADSVEFGRANELDQLFEVLVALAGKSHDEGRANGDAGHALSNAADQSLIRVAIPAPPHASQHAAAGVLERDVEVLADVRALGHHAQQLVGDRGRVAIHEANPFDAGHSGYGIDEARQSVRERQIRPVGRSVLRD